MKKTEIVKCMVEEGLKESFMQSLKESGITTTDFLIEIITAYTNKEDWILKSMKYHKTDNINTQSNSKQLIKDESTLSSNQADIISIPSLLKAEKELYSKIEDPIMSKEFETVLGYFKDITEKQMKHLPIGWMEPHLNFMKSKSRYAIVQAFKLLCLNQYHGNELNNEYLRKFFNLIYNYDDVRISQLILIWLKWGSGQIKQEDIDLIEDIIVRIQFGRK